MKQGWTYKKLGEVCEILNGFAFQSKNYVPNGIRVIRITNVQKGYIEDKDPKFYPLETQSELSRYLLKDGDLLLSLTGNVGRVAIIDNSYLPAYLNQRVACIRIKKGKELDISFLFHLLYSNKFEEDCIKSSKGAAQLNMSTVWLSSYPIPIPPLSEQQRIVERLDSAFAHIDELKANAEKQVNEARALFQKALSKAMEPKEGWEEKTLKEVGLTQTGTTPSKNDKDNYGDYIPFIRPSEIDIDGSGRIEYNSEIKLSEKGVSNGRLFKAHSILMVCIGATIGKVGFNTQDVSCNQQINILTPELDDYKFIYYAMRENSFIDKVIKDGTSAQATLPIINKGKWEKLTINVPPLAEQQRIVARLDSLSEKVRKYEEIQKKVIAECDNLKQALLRKVFE